jgi:cyclopropane-fatty-acyl-phospholipid synthase
MAADGGRTMNIETAADAAICLAERGRIPDPAVRWAIRRLCSQRLRDQRLARRRGAGTAKFISSLEGTDVAPVPDKANAQHYDLPPELFRIMLGPRLKYSACHWSGDTATLREAEDESLALTAEHAALEDGMTVLELGCGWGSLSLWMAERYPHSQILGVSNSASQRRHIELEAQRRGLSNVSIETADMNVFSTHRRFDRIVSVEMFEHMRNYQQLLQRIDGWLLPNGRLFVHVFCHRQFAYRFEEHGAGNWMGRHFFSGGLMPSVDLLPSVPSRLTVEQQWTWDGRHYARTANAWLANLDARRAEALAVLAGLYGEREAVRWLGRWRLFLMACAELFGYADGAEWGVAHYVFRRTAEPSTLGVAS